jgi:hypothetical protein
MYEQSCLLLCYSVYYFVFGGSTLSPQIHVEATYLNTVVIVNCFRLFIWRIRLWVTQPLPGTPGPIRPFRAYLRYAPFLGGR